MLWVLITDAGSLPDCFFEVFVVFLMPNHWNLAGERNYVFFDLVSRCYIAAMHRFAHRHAHRRMIVLRAVSEGSETFSLFSALENSLLEGKSFLGSVGVLRWRSLIRMPLIRRRGRGACFACGSCGCFSFA